MSWLFSQAAVEAFSPEKSLDGLASARWKKKSIRGHFYSSDRTTGNYLLSQFGTMLQRSVKGTKTAKSISRRSAQSVISFVSPEAFHVKIFRWQEKVQGLTATIAGFGGNITGSFTRYDPHAHSWKTHQLLLDGDYLPFSAPFPKWGIMLSGVCWELPTLELITIGKESGFWPTVTVCGNHNRPGTGRNSGAGLSTAVKMWPTPMAQDYGGSTSADFSMKLSEAVRNFPTPTRSMVTLQDMEQARYHSQSRPPYSEMFPTPIRNDAKQNASPSRSREARAARGSFGEQLSDRVGGSLNPRWVEWLMGWPIGWCSLKPLETDRYRQWRQQHFPYSNQ